MKKLFTGVTNVLAGSLSLMSDNAKNKADRVRDLRSPETVERMKTEAAAKRVRKMVARGYNHAMCISFNPCFKVGKPSQEFCSYAEMAGPHGQKVMVAIPKPKSNS